MPIFNKSRHAVYYYYCYYHNKHDNNNYHFLNTFFESRSTVDHCTTTWYEPPLVNINKMACAPSEDSDQPGHPPSLIRVFAIRMKKHWVLNYPLSALRRLWSGWNTLIWVFAGRKDNLSVLSWGGLITMFVQCKRTENKWRCFKIKTSAVRISGWRKMIMLKKKINKIKQLFKYYLPSE